MRSQSWFSAIPIFLCCWLAWLYVSSPEQKAYSGSYVFPTAMLSIRIDDPMHAEQLRRELDGFARSHRLRIDPYTAANQRKPEHERIHYSPPMPNLQVGFGMHLERTSSDCFVILFSEYSRAWTRASLNAFNELHEQLRGNYRERLRLVVRPKREQNWIERQRTAFEDPEWPSSLDHACSSPEANSSGNPYSSSLRRPAGSSPSQG